MEISKDEDWGPDKREPKGWIIEPGKDVYNHRFGGNSWTTLGPDNIGILDTPALLLTLDLRDPKLESLAIPQLEELPICSYINSNLVANRQLFEILPKTCQVKLVNFLQDSPEDRDEEFRLPLPLFERSIKLRAMHESDYPLTEDLYWKISEQFTGSSSFIRVLGTPIWEQYEEEEICKCGILMEYVCSIGCESDDDCTGLIPNSHFDVCGGGLYFFWCKTCLRIAVIFQTT